MDNFSAFKCQLCDFTTSYKYNLTRHVLKHSKPAKVGKNQYPCPLCSTSGKTFKTHERKTMLRHYMETHNVPIINKKLVFNTKEEFNNWKSSLEATEKCKFVLSGGCVQQTKNKIITTVRCFRDGFFHSKGQGNRHIKQKKSCKLGGMCPAIITASQDRCTGIVSVSYIGTHVGHEREVARLNLSHAERKDISIKIAGGVPFDTILDDVRNSVKAESTSEITRLQLLTRKDLWNIAKTYNLKCSSVRRDNDAAKTVATRKRHNASLELQNAPTPTEAGWLISSRNGHIYNISRHKDDYCNCEVKCEECRICVHSYKCSCPDSTIQGNICKHIHRLRMFLRCEESPTASPPAPPDESVEDDFVVDDEANLVIHGGEARLPDSLLQHLNNNKTPNHQPTYDGDLKKRKEKLMQLVSEIFDRITCDAHADIVDNALRPVIPRIEATNSGRRTPDAGKIVNPFANTSPQKNFVSAKKRTKDNRWRHQVAISDHVAERK